MKRWTVLAVLTLGVVASAFGATTPREPQHGQRIIGGTVTSIQQYPYVVAMLSPIIAGLAYMQQCGGTILTNRVVLSAAHCFDLQFQPNRPEQYRIRAGSTSSNSGGTVYLIQRGILHENYVFPDTDIALLRTASDIVFVPGSVAAGSIAGSGYDAGDDAPVWAVGWGRTESGQASQQLRHAQLYTINQQVCQGRFLDVLNERMICSGILDVGGIGQCSGDSGSPLIHQGVVIGVCSFGGGCGSAVTPTVNVRVSYFTNWIVNTVIALG